MPEDIEKSDKPSEPKGGSQEQKRSSASPQENKPWQAADGMSADSDLNTHPGKKNESTAREPTGRHATEDWKKGKH